MKTLQEKAADALAARRNDEDTATRDWFYEHRSRFEVAFADRFSVFPTDITVGKHAARTVLIVADGLSFDGHFEIGEIVFRLHCPRCHNYHVVHSLPHLAIALEGEYCPENKTTHQLLCPFRFFFPDPADHVCQQGRCALWSHNECCNLAYFLLEER